jgi:eukaryotic-like serine/threonine-protein kinase
MSRWEPGQEFDGYVLKHLIGKGGMGEVHLAHDSLLDRPVAVKFIATSQVDKIARTRFLVEARAIARLQHPNVVTIYRVGEVDGAPYLVSEYVPGKPLDEVDKPVDTELALRIGMDIACGLAAANRRGVLHRDIKPGNAILGEDGTVKLLDFGLAKLIQPRKSSGGTDKEVAPTDQVGAADAAGAVDVVDEFSISDDSALDIFGAQKLRPDDATPVIAEVPPSGVQTGTFTPTPVRLIAEPSDDDMTPRSFSDSGLEGNNDVGLNPDMATPDLVELAAMSSSESGDTPGELHNLTRTRVVLGTPKYMAPEVWRGKPATFQSDIYSLGALLYVMCAGRPPHKAKTLQDLRLKALTVDAEPLASLATQLDPKLAAIVDRCLKRDPAERYQSANEVRSAFAQLRPEARDTVVPEGNPYRGLHSFEEEHRNLFFGRDSEIRMILERLRLESFVLVAGDSGVGKSSLCKAGVLPRVGKWLDETRRWQVIKLIPGPNPLRSLCRSLGPVLNMTEDSLAAAVLEDLGGVIRRIRAWQGENEGLVIFIDQLEELVTIGDPEESRAVCELLGWYSEPSPGARILATVRGDFLSRVASLPRIGNEISRALFFLRALSEERIRDAITGPALAKEAKFESPDLVDELVGSAMKAGSGSLPLLQFALAELWDAHDHESKIVLRKDLESIGGVAGALSRHANRVLSQMLPPQRKAARSILVRLVTADGTRAHKSHQDLVGEKDEIARSALRALVRGRLVVARDSPQWTGYEIAHETLIKGWATFASWLSTDAEARRVRDRLGIAIEEWERGERSKELLWNHHQLQDLALLERTQLHEAERRFLGASRRALRWQRVIRFSVVGGVLIAIALTASWSTIRGRMLLQRRVGEAIKTATGALDESRELAKKARRLREEALHEFDKAKEKAAEKIWARYMAAYRSLDLSYARTSQLLETAMLLDLERSDVKQMFADLLFERAILAERANNSSQLVELIERLKLYDSDGSHMKQWRAPATVSFDVFPSGTELNLSRYNREGHRRYEIKPVAGGNSSGKPLRLKPGSYLTTLKAPGYQTIVYPFIVRRGESLKLKVELPKKVPRGYRYIPPGRFLFGSSAQDQIRREFFHAVPLHNVTTGGYLIAETETTFAQWIEYLKALAPKDRPAAYPRVGKGGFQGGLRIKELKGGKWHFSFQPTTEPYAATSGEKIIYKGRKNRVEQNWLKFPVIGISVADADKYVAWLRNSGRLPGARLCSELEWERAARGADGREYPHGDDLFPSDANYDDTYAKVPEAMGPDEVASHATSVSPFGLHDMSGNVWEWTRSSVTAKGYAARGGSWYFSANSARLTEREVTEPSFRDVSVGMRVCADPPALR